MRGKGDWWVLIHGARRLGRDEAKLACSESTRNNTVCVWVGVLWKTFRAARRVVTHFGFLGVHTALSHCQWPDPTTRRTKFANKKTRKPATTVGRNIRRILQRQSLHTAAGFDYHVGQRLMRHRVRAVHVNQLERRELRGCAARNQLQAFTFRTASLEHYFLQLKRRKQQRT